MAIPTILQGDTSSVIRLVVEEGDYTDCVLDVSFHGIVKRFENIQGGSNLSLEWTPDETKNFPLGTGIITMTVRRGDFVRSLPFAKLKVTDAPAEVYESTITIAPNIFDLPSLTAEDTSGDVKSAVNAIINTLRNGIGCIALMLCGSAFCALTPTTVLDDIPGNTTISNIVASSGAAVGGGGISDKDVASITNTMTVYVDAQDALKRDKTDYLAQGSYWVMTCHDDAVLIEGVRNFQGTKTSAKNKTVTVTQTSSRCTVTWPLDTGTLTFEVSLSFFANDEWAAPNKESGDIPYGAYTLRARWIAQNTLATRKDLDLLNADAVSFKDLMSGEASVLNKKVLDSMSSAIATIPTKETVKEMAGEALNTIYDEQLGVTWQARMVDGCLYYLAVTNTNISVIEE